VPFDAEARPDASPVAATAAVARPHAFSRLFGEHRLLLDTVLLGLAGALFAQLFTALLRIANRWLIVGIAGYQSPGLPTEGGVPDEVIGPHGLWLVPVVTTVAGLVVGIMVEWLAPEAEGHGTDAVIRAFHRADGFMRARVPLVKLLASAITIGSGGVAGREGPMALITGGVGSWYATKTGLRGRDRRMLLLVGMASGLSAIFRSPIGAALLAVEIPYLDMEFEPGALLYTALGSIVAYAANGMFVGWEPLFRFPSLGAQLPKTLDYGAYILLGIIAGVAATIIPKLFYGGRDFFHRLPVPAWARPAIGGLLTGLVALVAPKVIGGGYGWVQQAIDGKLALATLLLLVVTKPIAMTFTVSSGGSGGVFAPTLFVGAMLGGVCAAVLHQPFAPFVIVGMAAVFAGAAHVPIATMMMVTEMTGGYSLLVPATFAVMLSYLIQVRLTRGSTVRGLYEAQVTSRGDSPAHHERHLEIALQILRAKSLSTYDSNDEALLGAMRVGATAPLTGDRKLFIGRLRSASFASGRSIADSSGSLTAAGLQVLAVLRDEHMVAPRPDLVLRAGDGVILVIEPGAEQHASALASPW
jgi:CIC family chloride channel protein